MEEARNDIEQQVKETFARLQAERDALEDIKQATKLDISETLRLREKARILNLELERCEGVKDKGEATIKDLESHVAHQKNIVSDLQKEKESLVGLLNEKGVSSTYKEDPELICNDFDVSAIT